VQPVVKPYQAAAEFYTPERCYVTELSNEPDDPDVSIAQARVTSRVSTRWHRVIGTTERYVILAGHGRVELEGLPPHDVSPGDVVLIPASCPQRITNTAEEDLLFLAICSPRFREEAYEDLEPTAPDVQAS
jgi:mannose-6-phosphate isomerase-like protein (cupin superfamily)